MCLLFHSFPWGTCFMRTELFQNLLISFHYLCCELWCVLPVACSLQRSAAPLIWKPRQHLERHHLLFLSPECDRRRCRRTFSTLVEYSCLNMAQGSSVWGRSTLFTYLCPTLAWDAVRRNYIASFLRDHWGGRHHWLDQPSCLRVSGYPLPDSLTTVTRRSHEQTDLFIFYCVLRISQAVSAD